MSRFCRCGTTVSDEATDRGDTLENRTSTRKGARTRAEASGTGRWGRTLALVVILSLFWILLSGRFDLQTFLFMAAAVALVLALNPERPFGGARAGHDDGAAEGHAPVEGTGVRGRLGAAGHLLRYLAWLVWAVIRANVEVAILILHPRLPIRPRLLTFRTTLEHPVAKALVANSITLTPGTVTIDLEGDEYLVHALVPESARAVTEAQLQNVVAPIFGEGPDPTPEVRWADSYRELRT